MPNNNTHQPDDIATGDMREQINTLLGQMKVEEYGIKPRADVIDELMQLFRSYKQQVLDSIEGQLPERRQQIIGDNPDWNQGRLAGEHFILDQVHQVIAEMREK